MTASDRREGGNVLVFPDADSNFFHNSSWSDFPSTSKDFTPQIPKRVAPRRRNSMIETYSSHSDVFGSDVLTADPWVDFTDPFGMSQHGKDRDESFNTSEMFSDSSENDEGDFDPDFPSAEKPESGELGTMPLRDHNQKVERNRGRVSRGRQGRRGPRVVSSDEVGQKQPRRNRSRSKPSMVIGRRTRSLSVPKKAPAAEFGDDKPKTLSSHNRKPPPEDPFAEAEAENESKKKSKGGKSAKSKKEKPSKSPKVPKKSSKDKSDKSAKESKDKSLKAPKASRSKSPKSPRDKSPKVPKSSRSKSPRAERRSKSPRAERSKSPRVPRDKSPKVPKSSRSKSPRPERRSKSPRAERSKSPRVPRDKSPKVPKSSRSKSPKSPRDKTPKIPKPSRSKSPKSSRSKSPKSSRDRSRSSRDKSLKMNEEDKSSKSQVTEVSSPTPKASGKQTVAGSEKKKAQSLFASPLPPKSYLSRGTQKRCYAGVSKEIDQRKFNIKESLANLLSDEDKSIHRTILDDDDVESTGSAPRERKRSSSLPKRTGSDSSRSVQEVEIAHAKTSKPRRYRRHSIIGASRVDLEDDPKNCMVRPKSAESLMGTSGHSHRSKH